MYVWILFNNKHDRFTTCFKNLWNKILGFFCTFKSDNKACPEKKLEKSKDIEQKQVSRLDYFSEDLRKS